MKGFLLNFRQYIQSGLFFVAMMVSLAAVSQSKQLTLEQIDFDYQIFHKAADVRIQNYLKAHPDAKITFSQNKEVHLMVDVNENGIPIYIKTFNAIVATSLNVQQLRTGGSLGINLLGTGIRLGTWDGGKVRNDHVELVGRVTQVDGSPTLDDHATHTSGTMIASGINATAKGMAPEATLSAFDFNNDISEMTVQAKPDQTSLLLSNHSYGTVSGWNFDGTKWAWNGDPNIDSKKDYKFGFYDATTAGWDGIAFSAPYYLIVKAAGNDRTDIGDGTGAHDPDGPYDCIPTVGVAKNVITVGAVNKLFSPYTGPSDVLMSPFSSWGPTDDGRIKPDIVAPGVNVLSTVSTSTTSYAQESGTSMATPAVTGTLALLQQLYKSLNSGNYMRSASLKALALHTARETGANPGPDYSFGWGLLDAEGAARLILNKDNQNIFIKEQVLTSGQTFEMDLGIPKTATKIKATIVWTDPPGTPPSNSLNPTIKMLVNDLDLRVVDDGGTQQLPWILNPASPAAAATTGDNVRDNVEKIELTSTLPRNYKLRVTNKGTLVGGTQAFSLILEYSSQVDPLTTYYWIGNSGAWNNGAHWSLTSGGTAANTVPGANDRVVFDEKSFTAAGAVTLSQNQSCYSLRWFGNQFAVDFSFGGNTLTVAENFTLLTGKITTSTAGTINLTSSSTTPNSVDLNANALSKWILNFNGNSTWAVTGTASIDQFILTQGTASLNNCALHLNQLIAAGTSTKTIAFTNSSLQALASLSLDFSGIGIQSDNSSSIIISPTVTNSINLSGGNFQGIVDVETGSVSITSAGTALSQVRSVQGNGKVQLNGALLVSSLNLSGGSELTLQEGSTQTFTDKFGFSTSSSQRVKINSSGSGIATLAFNDYYKICVDNIDVTNVKVADGPIVNAGAGSTLTNSSNWLKLDCADVLFPDFAVSFSCIKSSTYFTDKSSGNITSRTWSFGDPTSGQNTSTLLNPLHYYATAGPFTATLTVTGVNGTRSASRTVTLLANNLADNTVQANNNSLISTVLAQAYQWLKDGQIISAAVSRSYTPGSVGGEYAVLIFDATCNKRSTPFIVTAVEEVPVLDYHIKIYPNPTSDFFQLETDDEVTATSLLDALGRESKVEWEQMNERRYRVNVSTIPTGLYILKVTTARSIEFQKIIIRK